jgi:putative selenate reductase
MVNDIVFEVRQRYQILNIINFCNKCGNCNTFCPTGGAPYMIKPGICLTKSSFEKEDKVYFLAGDRNHKSLLFKENGEIMSLTENGTGYIFETNQLTAQIIKKDFHISSFKLKTSSAKEIRFIVAAEMSVIIQGAYNLIFK